MGNPERGYRSVYDHWKAFQEFIAEGAGERRQVTDQVKFGTVSAEEFIRRFIQQALSERSCLRALTPASAGRRDGLGWNEKHRVRRLRCMRELLGPIERSKKMSITITSSYFDVFCLKVAMNDPKSTLL